MVKIQRDSNINRLLHKSLLTNQKLSCSMVKGLIISGQFGDICVREKSTEKIELGELLIAETAEGQILLEVFDLVFGSQLSQQQLELVSGLKLEEDTAVQLMDASMRNYVLARAKNIIAIKEKKAVACKILPNFFSAVREIRDDDASFFSQVKNPLMVGLLRSGSKTVNIPIVLDGKEVLSHHILVSGTTGKGKSVLMKNLLWECIDKDFCGLLVLDPHDEYYGRTGAGLKDHRAARERIVYYSSSPLPEGRSLKIHLGLVKPQHFNGVMDWSDAQQEALVAFYRDFDDGWIEAILTGKLPSSIKFAESTIEVVKRRMMHLLGVEMVSQNDIACRGVFDRVSGKTTLNEIVEDLDAGKKVIVDTSELNGAVELLIGSLIAHEILQVHRRMPSKELEQKPVISIVLEEAPRVLGRDVLERGPNVFSTIAREGRKFKVGLTAITQLPSLIPRQILANMNTKIILGTDLKPERQALIESSTQDLSDSERLIASLDKGEAIITSTFVKFATPIKIPSFEEKVHNVKKERFVQSFSGVNIQ